MRVGLGLAGAHWTACFSVELNVGYGAASRTLAAPPRSKWDQRGLSAADSWCCSLLCKPRK